MQRQIATGCMRAPRAVYVVVTEHRRGGCALPSELALILLNDYELRPERERRPAWVTCRQMSHPHSQQNTQHPCLFEATVKLGRDPSPLIDSKSINSPTCTQSNANPFHLFCTFS